MKRIFLALLCCCLLLAACGGKPENTGEPETLPPLPEEISQTEPEKDETDYAAALSAVFDGVEENPQTDFEYEVRENTAILTAFLGESEVVRVPARLGGVPVTAIADGVFANRTDIKTLILPATVTDYGNNVLKNTALTALCAPFPSAAGYLGFLWGVAEANGNRSPVLKSLRYLKLTNPSSAQAPFLLPAKGLANCEGLIALELPEGSGIGTSSLAGCDGLRYLNSETLTRVGEKALDGCASLQSLRFGAELVEIGFAALRDCKSLMELELPFVGTSKQPQTAEPSERTDFLGYLFGAGKPAFAKGFYPPFLKALILSEGCAELPEFALYECASLQTLVLPSTLTRVGGRALGNCTALTELLLPDACRTVGDAACAGCTALVRVGLPAGVTVGQNAFLGCPLQ